MNGMAVPVLGQHHKGSFQPGGMRHVVDFGGSGLRLAGARRPSMGQPVPEFHYQDAQKAVLEYDEWIKRAATVADADARGQIMAWVGRADVPGSPAERYSAVVRDLGQADAFGWKSVYATQEWTVPYKRVKDLEAIVEELGGKVNQAITAYGTLPVSDEAGGKTEAWNRSTLCLAGGIALLALVVVPLLLD